MPDAETVLTDLLGDSEQEETGSEELDPIAAASAALRSESDDKPETEEDDEGLPPDEEAEEEVEEDMDDLDEDEEQDEEDGKFTLHVPPNPNDKRSFADKTAVELDLTGLDQKAHDLIQSHITRSQQLTTVEEQLQTARTHQTVAEYAEDQPFGMMFMLEEQDAKSALPTGCAEKYVENWLSRHPGAGVELMDRLYKDADGDELDSKTLERTAKLAHRESKTELNDSLQNQARRTALKQFVDEAGGVIDQVAASLDLNEDERDDL